MLTILLRSDDDITALVEAKITSSPTRPFTRVEISNCSAFLISEILPLQTAELLPLTSPVPANVVSLITSSLSTFTIP